MVKGVRGTKVTVFKKVGIATTGDLWMLTKDTEKKMVMVLAR